NQGFTLGGLDLDNSTLTLVSATTDLTLDVSSSGWKLIAKQADSDEQLFSSNARSTFLENEDDPSQSTFMSIGNLNESNYADTDGKYKFKLVWGGKQVDSESINKEVTWTQTSWPEESTTQGFQEIGTSGYVYYNSSTGFRGLAKSTYPKCVIDGDGGTHGNWYNCVGVLVRWNGAMPGPLGKTASSMYLYIWDPVSPGTLVTQTADLTIVGGVPSLDNGTTISSTGGTFTFADGLSINGATVNLQDTTLAVGETFSNTGD
ncbi:uncharacterized protein METZ01_LOCUS441288, partial [marine metagenome]